ncbi:hypothetical protein BGZ94_005405, partial [Podila epigama]
MFANKYTSTLAALEAASPVRSSPLRLEWSPLSSEVLNSDSDGRESPDNHLLRTPTYPATTSSSAQTATTPKRPSPPRQKWSPSQFEQSDFISTPASPAYLSAAPSPVQVTMSPSSAVLRTELPSDE